MWQVSNVGYVHDFFTVAKHLICGFVKKMVKDQVMVI
jgi:hypothetical protein